ncbi:Negative regulator of mitotic exit [Saitozyma podzolica]|uniref:Negative regulator of mitotic exit n=1 Tax=Saitozyma podzolica TaxID=1890683 RepID=A0A427YDV4_9TREE|nr:Negative regulator of mitotic exit [Saitozyma podzolica]
MSLFKRKQSKDKDVGTHSGGGGEGPGAGPGASHASHASHGPNGSAAMPPGVNGLGQRVPSGPGAYGQPNGSTPPLANGRRMTSNNMQSLVQIPNTNSIQGPPNGTYEQPPNGSAPGYFVPGSGVNPAQRPPSAPAPPPAPAPSTSYPWSTRPLRLYAPQTSPPSAPVSPFPRYGLSVPAFPSHSGHMLLFGGLVHETVRNDLWSMDIRDCSTMFVKTKGDAPMPRVGHASAIADRIMLVWGGDTKVKQDDSQDEGLYILDLRTQEWTSVPVEPGPIGRYGHAVCMLDTKLYVFGGQAEGSFMNDLWSYDIRQLAGDTHVWEHVQSSGPSPPKRTGHALTSYQNKIYLFGGTDGNYHYNDTWAFDTTTNEWTELSCIGYIPVPREGHAAAIVDGTIYIFGGRDVNGKDLGDLAAFRITNQRWYMFQNMGPAPTARSGHALVAAHGKIYVLGGEANASSGQARDDPSIIHILDTVKIKYPADNQPPRQVKTTNGETVPSDRRDSSPPKPAQPSDTPQSVKRQIAPSASMDSLARAASPLGSSDRLASLAQASTNLPLAAPLDAKTVPRSDSLEMGQPLRMPPANANGLPPQRPKREGDDDYRRAMSPTNLNGPASPNQGDAYRRVASPPNGPASPPNVKNAFNASVLGTRSPSPRMRMAEGADRPAPPPDAFYYGRSPTANGFGGRPGSISGAADLMRELRAKEAEVDAGKKREAAMRVILGRAVQQGFVAEDDEDLPSGEAAPADEEVIKKLTDALVRMKQEKAAIQNELVSQMRTASEKAMDAERLRRGALQEAAFYRAKIATLESNSPLELARVEKERIHELERQLGALATEHGSTQRELERLADVSSSDKELHAAALERESETARRAEDAEEAHRTAAEELEQLRSHVASSESTVREHTERLITLSSTVQQREAERDQYRSQLDDAVAERDQHVGLIEQAQLAITAAGQRTAEMEDLHSKSSGRIKELESELAEARSELEVRAKDVEMANGRLQEVENAYAKSREEADSLRAVTTSRLGELLDSHKELRADESRAVRGHQEQLRALEEESKSLRKMLREAGQRLEDAEAGVSTHRQKHRDLEVSHQSLRAEMRVHRTKLLNAQGDLAKYKELYATKDNELRERDMAVTEVEMRCTVLRNLLAEHGIAVDDHDLSNAETSSSRDLETKLRDKERAHETAQREIEELNRRCQEAEDKVESLGRLVERIKDARSPTAMSMRSPSPTNGDSDRRVTDVEKKMSETESHYKEKLAALEADYQTAVRYVKGTEKMLNRMKGELSKQKSTNTALQTELDQLHGRPSEAGARTREASGRSTPQGIDGELQRRFATLQSQHSSIQAELAASRDVLSAREREVDVLRNRVEDAEREVEVLREDLAQAQHRINTLLGMGPGLGMGSGAESVDEHGQRRASGGSSEEASMAFDKFTKELKQWERSRSPATQESDEETAHLEPVHGLDEAGEGKKGHKRNSSEYSGDWAQ